jgi:hypothetical protein
MNRRLSSSRVVPLPTPAVHHELRSRRCRSLNAIRPNTNLAQREARECRFAMETSPHKRRRAAGDAAASIRGTILRIETALHGCASAPPGRRAPALWCRFSG